MQRVVILYWLTEVVSLEHSAGVSCLSGHLHRTFQAKGGHPLLAKWSLLGPPLISPADPWRACTKL